MFSKLFSKDSFEDLYPRLFPYIKEKDKQDKLINSQDFKTKYNKNRTLIDTFLKEVAKYHKQIEVISMVDKYIVSLDDQELVHMMVLYLNLPDEEKSNKKFFIYYDEEFGVINKTEEELNKEHQIDATYNNLKKGTETFNEIYLDVLYKELPYPLREYINSLLSNNKGWETFNILFGERYHANFKQLISLLNRCLIDGQIINDDVYTNLGENMFRELIYTLLSNNNLEVAKHIKSLISKNRYDLIKDMITHNLLGDQVFINTINNENINIDDLITTLEGIRVKRQVNN